MWCFECTPTELSVTCMPFRHQVVGLPDNENICNQFQIDPVDMPCCINQAAALGGCRYDC